MNKRIQGKTYEDLAAAFLQLHGYQILERNFRTRKAEIDLIALDEGSLVFIEVKYRTSQKRGDPMEAVGWNKQLRICCAADYYRMLHCENADLPCRFDAVAVEPGRIRLIRNAFPYRGRNG